MPLDEQYLLNKRLARQLYEDELAKSVRERNQEMDHANTVYRNQL